MSIKSRSKDSSSASTTSSSRSEGDSGSEVDSSSNVSDESDESNFTLVEIHYSDTKTVCKLCFRPAQAPDSGLRLGPLFQFGYCVAHLYCLMFSAGLDQNGSDDEGINGFLAKDIVKEWRRGSQLRCIYCKERYATIGCVGKGCKKGYHLPCGLENGSLQQFFGNFVSYCGAHKPIQSPFLDKKGKLKSGKIEMREECGCCTMELEDGTTKDFLWTPCCNGWFHRSCIEQTAENAGTHFFKCPLCNNKKDFTEEMLQFGVYVPDRDANWESENMFDDQLQRHDSCDADTCLCPSGRKFDEEDTDWEIMLCVCCGAQGIHVECGNLDKTRPRWKCPLCKPVLSKLPNKPISVFTRVKRATDPPNKEFTRNVLENLTFRVSNNYEIGVDMHKNRRDPKDPVIVGFKVNGVPAFDIPNPVKVKKNPLDNEGDKIKNIPCPYDQCDDLLSRLEFKDHCSHHKETSNSESNEEDNKGSAQKFEEGEAEISVNDNADVPENEITIEAANESIEVVEEIVKSPKLQNSAQKEKQSSILSFFKRFSPADGPPTKKAKLDRSASPILRTPDKNEGESKKVISSPVGYFKVDEEITMKSPISKV